MNTERSEERHVPAARWRQDQLARVGKDLLRRAHFLSQVIQERVRRLLEERDQESPDQQSNRN
jgi:hypothetical protein